jgi:excisionase family DNA binding protein
MIETMAQRYAEANFLTVAEVARLLRVSNMTVYRLISSGALRAVRVGKSYRLTEHDIDRYLARSATRAS